MASNLLQLAKTELARLPEAAEAKLRSDYELLYADTVAVKAAESQGIRFKARINALYRFLVRKLTELEKNLQKSNLILCFSLQIDNEAKKDRSPMHSFTHARLLGALEKVLGQISDGDEENDKLSLSDVSAMLSNSAKVEHFARISEGASDVDGLRAKILREISLTLRGEGMSGSLDGERWMELAGICYKLLKDFGDTDVARYFSRFPISPSSFSRLLNIRIPGPCPSPTLRPCLEAACARGSSSQT